MYYLWEWEFTHADDTVRASVIRQTRNESLSAVMQLTGLPASDDEIKDGKWKLRSVDMLSIEALDKIEEQGIGHLLGEGDKDA